MNRFLIKGLFSLFILIALAITNSFGQTITIGTVDAGPYAPGSTVAVPVHINYTGNCIPITNTFRLFFSNAAGVYTGTATATVNGSYITYMNFKIPAGTPAGTGYKVKITSSSNPGATIVASSAFAVTTGTGVTAGISAPYLNGNAGVFGNCNGVANFEFDFKDNSDPLKSSVTFFNEKTQTIQQTTPVAATGSFIADLTNYTAIVKATSAAGIVGTIAYPLLNNPASNTFQVANSGAACLTTGTAIVPFTIPTGNIQDNYPGNIYTIDWGDGSPKSVYTFCDIQASSGSVSHPYTTSSCGQPGNAFPVTCQLSNAYCSSLVTAVGSSAKVINIPTNKFTPPVTACTNTPVIITNNSDPGSDPSKNNCVNTTALYTWTVLNSSGAAVATLQNIPLSQPFNYTFTTAGNYTIQLELQNSGLSCGALPVSHPICIQDAPTPAFHFTNTTVCIADQPIAPVNTSTIPANSCVVAQYQWSITPSAGVTFNAASATPQFSFTNPGVYQVGLTITTTSCGPVVAPTQTLTVNSTPVVQLSADYNSCGNNQTLSFSNVDASSPTYTVLSGTAAVQPDTYTWTVTGGAYSFAPGFTANSKYPNIIFNDYAAYTVTIVQKNNCNSVSKTQKITFQQAPTVDAGTYASVCATGLITLNGQIKPDLTQVVSYKWTGGTGTYTPNANTLTATYKPSAAEINAGKVTLILEVTTAIASPCNLIDSRTTITITPTDVISSSLTPPSICSNTKVNYKIASPDADATFTWTAKVLSGSATGLTATGSGALINDQLVNTDPTASTNAIIDYTITPTNSNGCPGTPADVMVTVTPLPLIKAIGPTTAICSSSPAGITVTSSVSGTQYTWTSTATGPITGNTTNPTATDIPNGIQDILINNGNTPVTVTYTFTPVSSTSCTGGTKQASVIVNPAPVVANAGSDFKVCNLTSVQLKGNSPPPGTGAWTVVPSAGVTFADATSPTTTVSGLVAGTTYKFTWTISLYGCSTSNDVNVTVNAPTVAGITSTADQSIVCAGDNSGVIVLSGQIGSIIWEASTDNGTTWAPITPENNTTSLSYLNLTLTTIFRAIVQNGSCDIAYSTPTTITVNQPAVTAYVTPTPPLCNVTSYTMQGNDPGVYPGFWKQLTGPTVTFDDITKYNAVISNMQGGNVYSFTWNIKAASPCASSSYPTTIQDAADVTPGFTADKTAFCGEQTVTFTNTSNNPDGAQFSWDFGDGSAPVSDVSPQHVFAVDPSGHDKTYHVTLTIIGNCAAHPPHEQEIIVRPATPDAHVVPSAYNGCGPTQFTVKNLSSGDNDTYDIYVKDAQGNKKYDSGTLTDKSSVTFTLSSDVQANFALYVDATDQCGTTNTSVPITLSMSPGDIASVLTSNDNYHDCLGFAATFVNSSGGTSFYYMINGPSGATKLVTTPGTQSYTFPAPGVYTVQLFASDACSQNVPSQNILTYTIDAQPEPAFDATTDCTNMATFKNNTPDPTGVMLYTWDYGDGTTGTDFFHQYTYDAQHSTYQATLTATNTSSKCFNSISKTVITTPLLTAAFEVLPSNTISLPDYHFNFADQSTGSPTSWQWDFGDGQTSTQQNPGHTYTYGNVGDHTVKLIVTKANCSQSTTQQTVTITGVPGQLFLPNAFIPDGSSQALRIFMAKGAGIKTWMLQIFNNYGQLMWQTTKLDSNGSPVEGWDGMYKGSPAPQGAYTWQASATFINGSDWKGMSYQNSLPKRTGTVNLIR